MPTKPRQFRITTRPRIELKRDPLPAPKQTRQREIRASWRWQKYSRRLRKKYPLCMAPFCRERKAGRWPASAAVHHIEPLRTHSELAFDEANTVPICHGCHGWIEAIERRGYSTASYFMNWQQGAEDDA